MSPVDKLRAAARDAHNAVNRAWNVSWGVGVPDLDEFIDSMEEALRKARALRLARSGGEDELPPHGAVGERDSQ
jgi:hypothetical protein